MRHFTPTSQLLVIGLILISWSVGTLSADEPANLLLNPGAEQGKKDLPSAWYAARIPADGLRMWRTTDQFHSGKASLAISNEHEYKEKVCNNWAQDLQELPLGKTVQISAYMRSEDADEANICIQCWDSERKTMLAFASTPVVRGDQEWTRVQIPHLFVPSATTSITVRASLCGKGKVWFDDFSLVIIESQTGQTLADNQNALSAEPSSVPTTSNPSALVQESSIDAELRHAVPGNVVKALPIIKDCMVLSYMPDWSHGEVDNIGVANNDGGVRTFLAWPAISPEDAAGPEKRFILALYSRKTTAVNPTGQICAYEVLADWKERVLSDRKERTSWTTQPKVAPEPAATFEFVSENGWKLFDITALIREQSQSKRNGYGAMLRFDQEDRSGGKANWSGYECVSREGAGEWAGRRPLLLVVEPAQ